MSKISEMYDENIQEKVDNIPYLKFLYRDGEAVGSIIKHESVAGTMFVVTGYTLEPCFKGSSNNYSREYGYETEWTDNPSEVLAAYSEALDKALEDMGASDENDASDLSFVGFTNGDQISYAKETDGEGCFYSSSDNDCVVPLYMLKIHTHRLGGNS